jgi:hypothetical protein
MRRAHELFGLAMTARSAAAKYSSPDMMPDRRVMAEFQNAASRAGGVPWLISGLLASYTGITVDQQAAEEAASREIIVSDMRLLDDLCRIAGFLPGSDMRWFLECLQELAGDTLRSADPEFVQRSRSPTIRDTRQEPGQTTHHLLHLLGSEHLVHGRYNPSRFRSLDAREIGDGHTIRRLRRGAVDMLAALAGDAKRNDRSWAGFTGALGRLGAPPARAERLARLFGPLTEAAAQLLTVQPPTRPQSDSPFPSIDDRAGATLALSDLVAISALLADRG